MKKITIYTSPTCHFCHMAKEFFKENSVVYEEFDVMKDAARRKEMVDLTGQMGVPVILVDGEMVLGFDEPKLRKLLGL